MLAVLLVLLSAVAFTPLFLVALGEYPGSTYEKFEGLLSDRQELIIALGTLFLVAGFSVWGNHLSNSSAERRERVNRTLMAELKIAEFRQQWIDELRKELAAYYALAFTDPDHRDMKEFGAMMTKIRMRLNLTEPLALDLYISMLTVGDIKGRDPKKIGEDLSDYMEKGHKFLRGEWVRLKKDIRDAQLLVEDAP